VASVEGESFTAEVVARIRRTDDHELLEDLSGELDRRHRLVRAQGIERIEPALGPSKEPALSLPKEPALSLPKGKRRRRRSNPRVWRSTSSKKENRLIARRSLSESGGVACNWSTTKRQAS
jgi:hypothetical protein